MLLMEHAEVGAIEEIAATRASAEMQATDSLAAQIRAEEAGARAAQRTAGDQFHSLREVRTRREARGIACEATHALSFTKLFRD